MSYTTLQTIAIICYMIAGGLLAISVMLFFLWDMKEIFGRITGNSQRRELERMRTAGKGNTSGSLAIDMSVLESSAAASPAASGRLSRRSGRVSKGAGGKSAQLPAKEPVPARPTAPDYFGAPYANKTPPTPVPPRAGMEPPAAETTMISAEPASTGETMDLEQWQQAKAAEAAATAETTIMPPLAEVSGETMDLAQWEQTHAPETLPEGPVAEPVKLTLLDDILLLHTETFIDLD